MLAARRNGRRNLVRLGRAENENHPGRRLFDRLQQRVERLAGDLMGLVHDEYFVAIARRPVADVLPQLAHLIDAAIGGASISITSTAPPAAISMQLGQTPQG